MVEPMLDQLMSNCWRLAACSKKMQELYGKEAKCWKNRGLFLTFQKYNPIVPPLPPPLASWTVRTNRYDR